MPDTVDNVSDHSRNHRHFGDGYYGKRCGIYGNVCSHCFEASSEEPTEEKNLPMCATPAIWQAMNYITSSK